MARRGFPARLLAGCAGFLKCCSGISSTRSRRQVTVAVPWLFRGWHRLLRQAFSGCTQHAVPDRIHDPTLRLGQASTSLPQVHRVAYKSRIRPQRQHCPRPLVHTHGSAGASSGENAQMKRQPPAPSPSSLGSLPATCLPDTPLPPRLSCAQNDCLNHNCIQEHEVHRVQRPRETE